MHHVGGAKDDRHGQYVNRLRRWHHPRVFLQGLTQKRVGKRISERTEHVNLGKYSSPWELCLLGCPRSKFHRGYSCRPVILQGLAAGGAVDVAVDGSDA